MSGWIKWEKDLETDIRFVRLCRQVRDTCNAGALRDALPHNALVALVIGALMKLWSYADTHIRADDTLDLGFDDIDELVGLTGFAAAVPEDWLILKAPQCVELPGFQEHNGTVAKKRDLGTKRQQRRRALQNNEPVTQQRDKRNAIELPDQTRLDQTRPKKKPARKVNGHKAPKTAIPPDFALDPELTAYAETHLPKVDPIALLESFKGKALAKGWEYANWRQAMQEFIRNCAPNSGHWASGQYPKQGGGQQWQ